MIEFLARCRVWSKIRIRVRVMVMFNNSVYHLSNCHMNICRTFLVDGGSDSGGTVEG